MSDLRFKLAAGTNVGLLRPNNEDNFIVCPDLSEVSEWLIPQTDDFTKLGSFGALMVVADGMGGMNAGEVASAITIDTIQHSFSLEAIAAVVNNSRAVQEFMESVVKEADLNVLRRSQKDSSTQGMGTTVVMAWILGKRAYVCWCGDSRCYVFSKKKGLRQLSKDHSFVQELVDRGELAPEYANDHPLSNIVTRCLGNEERRAQPDTRVYELSDGDTILLCSDGLSGLCNDELISEVIAEFSDNPSECRNELISAALSHGGHDNVTVAICTINMDEKDDGEVLSEDVAQDEKSKTEESVTEDKKKEKVGFDSDTDEIEKTSKEGKEEKKEETTSADEKEELSVTIRNGRIKQRGGKIYLFLLLLLVLAAVLCFVFIKYGHETVLINN